MLIVAYLYNNNGMASWCWEAAHALHEANQPVLLICSPTVQLPGDPQVEILRFEPKIPKEVNQSWMKKVGNELARLSDESSDFTYELHEYLLSLGILPSAYFLNQSNLQDPRVAVAQHVVAWAYPTSLKAYISKVNRLTALKTSTATVRIFLDSVGWWRKDWRAYRSATSVLAVSQILATELMSKGVNTKVVHPGTDIASIDSKKYTSQSRKLKFLIASVGLEDPRKRVRWMLEALKADKNRNYELTLVGDANESFKQWVCSEGFPATFTGLISRHKLTRLMAEHDVFLFGSCLDDWGYVLVEAMSQGMIVIAPDLSPFDEILGDPKYLFNLNQSTDFIEKMKNLTSADLSHNKIYLSKRAEEYFSRKIFSKNLLKSL